MFNFNQIPNEHKRRGAFIPNIKAGLVVKTGTKWLPTHKLFTGNTEPMPSHWLDAVITKVSDALDNDYKSPSPNGSLQDTPESFIYKWIDCESHPRTGIFGIQSKKFSNRLEITESHIYGLHHDKLYITELPPHLKTKIQSIFSRTPNQYKGSKVNKEISTGLAEDNLKKDNPSISSVIGLDESGRGALAGPLVACASYLNFSDTYPILDQVKDSKALDHNEISSLSEKIQKEILVGKGIVSVEEINSMNLDEANLLAFKRALDHLKEQKPDIIIDHILVDGLSISLKDTYPNAQCIAQGEGKSKAIAAASIVAKDTHDKEMLDIHFKHPQFDFKTNKGYGTPTHLKFMDKFGVSPFHRLNFKPVQKALQKSMELDLGI